ncbi:MAG: hypothetical protein JWR69_732 [Pedosphaera sp.]|nr:hypothetical protein [Pedosphaera sp.]
MGSRHPLDHLNMKTALRFVCLALAVLFSLISLLLLLSGKQINKNKMELADMKDCVHAIKEFEKKTGRLPSQEELGGGDRGT